MGSSEVFEHTADLGLRISAENLDDLFRTAAEALFDVIAADRTTIRPLESETVELRADSPERLLVDWLNELIFRVEVRHRFYGRFDVKITDDGRSLSATIAGEPIDPDRHALDHEVKAATHHGLFVRREEGGGWLAELILDI